MTAPSAETTRAADEMRESPYVGLTAYAEGDSDFFFGREREIGVVRGNLQGARLTLFYGESGVGKSSVLLAGVVGRMRSDVARNAQVLDEEFDGEAPFAVAVFRSWVDPPVAPLMEAIRAAASTALGGRELQPWSPDESQDRSPLDALRDWTRDVRTIYVVLDQFEEYFLYSDKDSGPVTFAETFPRIVNDVSVPVHFIISMREDALAKLDRFKDVVPIYSNALRLDYLDERAARDAIEGPLDRYTELYGNGERFRADTALVREVIRQIQEGPAHIGDSTAARVEATDGRPGPIGTPLLQLVLTRLWEEERALGSHVLRLVTLQERLRGTEEIVRTQLDRTLQDLTDEERRLAARSFRFLVTPSGSKIAHTAGDLAMYIDAPESELRRVLAKLDEASIVRTIAPPPGQKDGASRYEIAHDVLGPAVVEWAAREQHELEVQEQAKEQAERHRTRFARRLAAVLTISTLAAGTLAVAAWQARNEATSERDAAQANARVADALRQLTADPPAALRAAIGAVEEARTPTSESALRAALAQPHEVALATHEGGLTSASVSSDGSLVATAGRDGTVRLWNARTGAAEGVLGDDTRPVIDVAFSRDGKVIATASADGTVRVMSRQTDEDRVLRSYAERISDLAFSPDGRLLATAGPGQAAQLLDVRTGEVVRVLRGHEAAVNGVDFSPDGELIATAGNDLKARVWDVRSRAQPKILEHRDVVASAVFSPDGRYVVTASWDATAQLWDAGSGEPVGTPFTHQTSLRSAAFAPDGALVVTAGEDGTARLWDVTSRQAIGVLVGHTAAVHTAELSPDGRFVITASVDGTMRIWAADANPSLRTLGRDAGPVTSVAFNPDASVLATAGPGPTARLWNARTGEPGRPLHDGDAAVNGVAFSPDGQLVATAGDDETAQIWNVRTGERVRLLDDHRSSVVGVAFSPDGRLVATAGWDDSARVWDVGTGDSSVLRHAEPVNGVAFSPDGELIVTGSDDGTAQLWNVGSDDRSRVLRGHARKVNGVAFSPGGELIATASDDETARLWNVRSGESVRVLRGHTDFVKNVSFSRDGALVVTASSDNTARVWDVQTGTTVAVLQRHGAPLSSAVFSPGGDLVATATDDGARIHACGSCPSIDVLLERAHVLAEQSERR